MIPSSGYPPWPPDHPRTLPRTSTPTPPRGARSSRSDCRAHRRWRGSWWSARPCCGRSPDPRPVFGGAGRVLMRAHEGRVDHGVFVVGGDRQVLEHPLPYAGLGPATEAGLHRDPTAEPLGPIAPGDARPIAVEHRLHEEPVILGGHAHMPDPPRQQILDPRPLIISHAVASHRSAPHR